MKLLIAIIFIICLQLIKIHIKKICAINIIDFTCIQKSKKNETQTLSLAVWEMSNKTEIFLNS